MAFLFLCLCFASHCDFLHKIKCVSINLSIHRNLSQQARCSVTAGALFKHQTNKNQTNDTKRKVLRHACVDFIFGAMFVLKSIVLCVIIINNNNKNKINNNNNNHSRFQDHCWTFVSSDFLTWMLPPSSHTHARTCTRSGTGSDGGGAKGHGSHRCSSFFTA